MVASTSLRSPETVLDTTEDEGTATRLLHEWAARLRQHPLGDTDRFGIYKRRQKGVWQIVFLDRQAKRARGQRATQEGALWTNRHGMTAAEAVGRRPAVPSCLPHKLPPVSRVVQGRYTPLCRKVGCGKVA